MPKLWAAGTVLRIGKSHKAIFSPTFLVLVCSQISKVSFSLFSPHVFAISDFWCQQMSISQRNTFEIRVWPLLKLKMKVLTYIEISDYREKIYTTKKLQMITLCTYCAEIANHLLLKAFGKMLRSGAFIET